MEVWAGNGGGDGEGGDLSEGVDAGIGAAGPLGQDGFSADVEDGLGERALHGREAGLDLPAVERGAVVSENGLPKDHTDDIGRYHEGGGEPGNPSSEEEPGVERSVGILGWL